MRLFIGAAIVLLITTVIPAASMADDTGRPGPWHVPPVPPSILNLAADLDFTPAQVEKLMEIEKNSKKNMEMIQEEFKKLMARMQDEMEKDNTDTVKINALIDKMSLNHTAMLKARTRDMLAIKAVLTKQQREKMRKIFKRPAGHGSGGPEGMMGGPGPMGAPKPGY
jgi:Spy/CpxP family protein refolding chaperone